MSGSSLPTVEQLGEREFDLIRPLLVDLHIGEQRHYPDHPQLTRKQIERNLETVPARFGGENVIFAVRDGDELWGFCWCVLFDPGTGLEGEIAEVYVADGRRSLGVGKALIDRAIELFVERGVTLAYVWTRDANEPAVRLYRSAGFADSAQLVLTWYPHSKRSGGRARTQT